MKNYGDLRGCYPPWPTASTDNALLDLHKILGLILQLLNYAVIFPGLAIQPIRNNYTKVVANLSDFICN